MNTNFIKIVFIFVYLTIFGLAAWCQFPGGQYLGQPLPGMIPEQFASGLLPEFTSDVTFSPDGKECYISRWSPGLGMILMTTKEDGNAWPEFDTAFFSVDLDQSPHLTPDGNRLYFICYKPIPPSTFYIRHLWYTDRIGTVWSDPVVMASPIIDHYVISVSAASNGNLYMAIADNNDPAIYISRLVNGSYLEPEKLSDSVNFLNRPLRPHIAADESFIVFDVGETPDPLSQRDIAISYRTPDGSWTKAELFDGMINTAQDEYSRFVTRDNQLMFFGRDADNLWVDANGLITGIVEDPVARPTLELFQNFPNPSNGNISIEYFIPKPGEVRLSVFNSFGKEVAVLVNERKDAGKYVARYETGDLTAGVYEYVLKANNSLIARKMICTR